MVIYSSIFYTIFQQNNKKAIFLNHRRSPEFLSVRDTNF